VKVYNDLIYAQAGEYGLCLDLYVPDDVSGPCPLVVWVHGGAFRMGDKANPIALPLVGRGYAVASINYRLSQEAIFPAQIHDCKAAVRWLRAHAGAYNLDGEHVGAWGDSAGGHLVTMLGTTGDVVELEGDLGNLDHSSRVQAVCDWYGPSDFLRMNDVPGTMDHDAPDSPESQLIGAPIQGNPDLVARANPITYVTPDAPPFLIMHGDQDLTVLPNQSEFLYRALVADGVESELVILPGLGHGFGQSPGYDALVGRVADFFDRNLRSGGWFTGI
jgi:acetyl esterase/lipase